MPARFLSFFVVQVAAAAMAKGAMATEAITVKGVMVVAGRGATAAEVEAVAATGAVVAVDMAAAAEAAEAVVDTGTTGKHCFVLGGVGEFRCVDSALTLWRQCGVCVCVA